MPRSRRSAGKGAMPLGSLVRGLFLLFVLCSEHAIGVEARVTAGVTESRLLGVTSHLSPLLTRRQVAHGGGPVASVAYATQGYDALFQPERTGLVGAEADAWDSGHIDLIGPGGYGTRPGLVGTALEGPSSPLWDGDTDLDLLLAAAHTSQWDWLDRRKAEARELLRRAKKNANDFGNSVADGYNNLVDSAQEQYDAAVKMLDSHREAFSEAGVATIRKLRQVIMQFKNWLTGLDNGPEQISGFDIVGSIIFGFLNGFLMGIGDVVRDALRHPDCDGQTRQVQKQFQVAADSILSAMIGLFDGEIREGRSRREMFRIAIEDNLQLLKDLWTLISGCKPLLITLGLVVLVVAVSIVIILLLAATVVGLLIKIAGIIITIVTGIAFVWKTLKTIVDHIKNCVNARKVVVGGKCAKRDILGIIEGVSSIGGFIVQCVVLSGLDKIIQVKNIKAALQSKSLKSLKVKWHPEMADDFAKFSSQMSAIKDGAKVKFSVFKSKVSRSADKIKARLTTSKESRAQGTKQANDIDMFNGRIDNKVGIKNMQHLDDVFGARKALYTKASEAAKKAQAQLDEAIAQFPGGKPPPGSSAEARIAKLARRADIAKEKAKIAEEMMGHAEYAAHTYKWEGGSMERALRIKDLDEKALSVAHKHLLKHSELSENFGQAAGKFDKASKELIAAADELTAAMKRESTTPSDLAKLQARVSAAEKTAESTRKARDSAVDALQSLWNRAKDVDDPYISKYLESTSAGFMENMSRNEAALNHFREASLKQIQLFLDLDPHMTKKFVTPENRQILKKLYHTLDKAAKEANLIHKEAVSASHQASVSFREVMKMGRAEFSQNKESFMRVLMSSFGSHSVGMAAMLDSSEYKYRITVLIKKASFLPSIAQRNALSGPGQVSYVSVVYDGASQRTALRNSTGMFVVPVEVGGTSFEFNDKIEIYTNTLDRQLRIAGVIRRGDDGPNSKHELSRHEKRGHHIGGVTSRTRDGDLDAGLIDGEAIGIHARAVPRPSGKAILTLARSPPKYLTLYPMGAGFVPATFVTPRAPFTNVAGLDRSRTYGFDLPPVVPEDAAFGDVGCIVVTEKLGHTGLNDPGTDLNEFGVDGKPVSKAPTVMIAIHGKSGDADSVRENAEVERAHGSKVSSHGNTVSAVKEDRCEEPDATQTGDAGAPGERINPQPFNLESLKPMGKDCISYQISSLAVDQVPQSVGPTLRDGEMIWLQCREAMSPSRAGSTRCMTDFGTVYCSSRKASAWRRAMDGKSGTVTFGLGGPVFRACGRFSGFQCDIRYAGGSAGSFRLSPSLLIPYKIANKMREIETAEERVRIVRESLRDGEDALVNVPVQLSKRTSPLPTLNFLFGDLSGSATVRFVDGGSRLEGWLRSVYFAKGGFYLVEHYANELTSNVFSTRKKGTQDTVASVNEFYSKFSQHVRANSFNARGTCPLILSHRGVEGASGVENSLRSLVISTLHGVDGVEIDVFLAGSSKLGWTATTLHDHNLDRLTGYALDVTGWSELQLHTFGLVKKALDKCALFPDFEQVVQMAKVFKVALDVELKPESPLDPVPKGYSNTIGAEVGRILRKYDYTDNVVVSGFDPKKLRSVNDENTPENKKIQVAMGHHGSAGSTAINIVNDVVGLDQRETKSNIYRIGEFSKRKVANTHKDGGYAGAYTFYDMLEKPDTIFYSPESIKEAVEAKIDWIETDNVNKLYDVMETMDCKPLHPRERVANTRRNIAARIFGFYDTSPHQQNGPQDGESHQDFEKRVIDEDTIPKIFENPLDHIHGKYGDHA